MNPRARRHARRPEQPCRWPQPCDCPHCQAEGKPAPATAAGRWRTCRCGHPTAQAMDLLARAAAEQTCRRD